MAMAINNRELLVSTISFETLEIDFNLDLKNSISETKRRHFDEVFRNMEDKVYLDGDIAFRSSPSNSATYILIPGQDAGPFHVLIPRFQRIIQAALNADLSGIVQRGQLSATIKDYTNRFYKQGDSSLESTLKLLQQYSVVESYLGRICFYRYKEEFILEVEKIDAITETFIEIVSASELSSLLAELRNYFHQGVLDGLRRSSQQH